MVTKKIDLHTHTTYSDGTLTPEELIQLAKKKELSAISITDHDTIDGVKIVIDAGIKNGIEVIPGVEISAQNDIGHTHILGYFVDIHDKEFCGHLQTYIKSRNERNPKIIERLNELEIPLTLDDVEEVSSGKVVNRPHIAQALVNKGYAKTKVDAFNRYLDKKAPAYVPKQVYSADKAISIIQKAGGLAIIAHPQQLGNETLEGTIAEIKKLIDLGIDGIEAYHGECPPQWCQEFASLAKDSGLLITGGSDFHGDEKHCDLGQIGGRDYLSYAVIEKMKSQLCANKP